MYCKKCGTQVDDNVQFCPSCGASLTQSTTHVQETGNKGWGVLGFFFPLVGLILYLVWRDDRPMDSKFAGKGALIGVIVAVACGIISGILFGIITALIMASEYSVFLPMLF
ncbi:MAG: zinc ribbon domain-containing protein [Clostridia bacterium]|nr:zinc ribbon domain-containing protein [Clostridia bacterium]